MDYSELLRHVDHTLLTPTATWDQVKTVCDEGLTCRTVLTEEENAFVKAHVPMTYSIHDERDRGRHPRGSGRDRHGG